jgi:hypothetical protein
MVEPATDDLKRHVLPLREMMGKFRMVRRQTVEYP